MLELAESHVIAQQLRSVLLGKRIAQVEAAQSPHGFGWYFGDPAAYDGMLSGKAITDVQPSGGQVEIYAEDMRIVFNDGVNIRYLAPGVKPSKKHQLYILFDDESAIVCTVQMYGGMMAFPAGTYDNFYYLVGKEKPTPFTDAFDEKYFMGLVEEAGPKASAKMLLATEQRIPGFGNGSLQDVLFGARIHPQTKLGDLGAADLKRLYKSLKEVLFEMRKEGGRDTEKDLFGRPGGYKTVLSSKTLSYPCRSCGGGITRKAYLGGNVYFCDHCQPLRK